MQAAARGAAVGGLYEVFAASGHQVLAVQAALCAYEFGSFYYRLHAEDEARRGTTRRGISVYDFLRHNPRSSESESHSDRKDKDTSSDEEHVHEQ